MAEKRSTKEMLQALQRQGVQDWVVLIVDDDPDNLELACFILTWQRATVHTALDGQEGLELLQKIKPNLILLDLSMPNLDGWAMIEQIRSMPHVAHTPVIALTAHAMETDRFRAENAGFNGYITKPFRISGFVGGIYDCVSRTMNAGV